MTQTKAGYIALLVGALVFSVTAIAAAVFFSGAVYTPDLAQALSYQPTSQGDGEVLPACGGLSTSATCQAGGLAQATITWGSTADCSSASASGSFGNFTNGACSGTVTFNDLPPSTDYSGSVTFLYTYGDPSGDSTKSFAFTTPTCLSADISAIPDDVIDEGASTDIEWTSTNTARCDGSNISTGGATVGSEAVSPLIDTTYGITCEGLQGGYVSDSVLVRVLHPASDISVTPSFIARKSKATLVWTSENVETCTVSDDDGNLLSTDLSGTTETVELTGKTVFTLRCVNSAGVVVSDKAIVNVPPGVEEF
jgi:hypothetical protein